MDRRGAVYAALTAILYGTSYVATGIALRSFGTLAAGALRGLLGATALALVLGFPAIRAAIRNADPPPRGALVRLAVLGLLGGPIFIIAMNTAVSLAGATITSFVAGLYAVLAAVFAIPLLRERPSVGVTGSLLLALIGTALLAELEPSGSSLAGIGWGLVAAVSFGLFLTLSRKWSAPYRLPGPMVGFAGLGLTGLLVGLAVLTTHQPILAHPPQASAVAAVLWLAVGPGALAAVLVVSSMRRLRASEASAFLLLNPPTAALAAFVLLGERLSPIQLAGGILVLVAIAAATGASALLVSSR